MKIFFLIFIILVIIQWNFKMKQAQEIHGYYEDFLKGGNVLAERYKGTFSGAIVMFKLDHNANILDCVYLSGATFLASWKRCHELIGQNLLQLQKKEIDSYKKPLQKAIFKAIKSYEDNLDLSIKNS